MKRVKVWSLWENSIQSLPIWQALSLAIAMCLDRTTQPNWKTRGNQPTNQPTNQVHSISATIFYSLKAITQGHQSKTTISQLHDTLLEGCRRLNKWCRPLHPWTRRLPHWDRRFGSILCIPIIHFDESINHLETYPMSDHSLLCSFRFLNLWTTTNGWANLPSTTSKSFVPTVGTFVSGTSSGIPSNQGSSPPWFGRVGFSPNFLADTKKKWSNWLASSFRYQKFSNYSFGWVGFSPNL